MTKIQSVNQLAAIIRSQIESTRNSTNAEATEIRQAKKKNLTSKVSTAKEQDVSQLIAQRIAEIPFEDAQRRRKAFRIFLELILLDELGGGLIADPRFFLMIDHVQNQMTSDAELASLIEQATDLLLLPQDK